MSAIEVIPVVLVLLVAASILWSTVRTGMSPMPSLSRARKAMLAMVPDEPPGGTIIDMGSGWGSLAIPCARRFPERQVVGYELSFFPWLFSVVMARLMGLGNLRFYRRDFQQADLSQATVLLCYLMPRGMGAVRTRLQTDPGAVTTVISHHFALAGHEPSQTMTLNDLYQTPVYCYHFPGKSA